MGSMGEDVKMTPNNRVQDIFNVDGMVAVVTGGGSGLGLYAARALDANGAKAVYILGRRFESLQKAAATAINGTMIPIACDITNKDSLQRAVDQIESEQGLINLLFANSGAPGPNHSWPFRKDVQGMDNVHAFREYCWGHDMEAFTQCFNVNATGMFYTCLAFLDLLDAGNQTRNVPQDSQILVTTSLTGYSRFLNDSFAYSGSKAAANHIAKMLSTLFAQQAWRIRVNIVAPGLYCTEMTQPITYMYEDYKGEKGHADAFKGALKMPHDRYPAERTGSEEEFAGTVLFMASRAGGFMNGEQLLTDGGKTSTLPATY